jgi:homoserine O-succinyltransferase
MPLIMERPRALNGWPAKWKQVPARFVERYAAPADCLKIALINNMPDSALEDTELQFFDLIHTAAGEIPVCIELYSLPGIPRSERGQERLSELYSGIDVLWDSGVDCAIVTGTEPRKPELREEPYWPVMTDLFDWAAQNTVSTVLSCLAAHAGVLHSDGIVRRAQTEKIFGVFEERRIREHALTESVGTTLHFPHSRWNDVAEHELTSCGYEVLTESAEAGAGLFVKKRKRSLFVHFQGHPEYGLHTLLKEYRRDTGRYLRRERQTYPELPRGYFSEDATRVLTDFRTGALSHPHGDLMQQFPEEAVANSLQNVWRTSAVRVYRSWLEYVASRKGDARPVASVARLGRAFLPNSARAV